MSKKIICLDTETTGLSIGRDELLQLSIIDDKLNELFNDYIKPITHTEWPNAMETNKITPEMVKDKPTLFERKDEIINILNSADIIIGFNSDKFDIPFLEAILDYKIKAKCMDVKKMAEKEFGLYSKIQVSLEDVGNWFNLQNEKAHDSLADTRLTMKIFNKMIEEGKKPKLSVIYTFEDGKSIYTKELADKYEQKSGSKIKDITYLEDNKIIEKPNENKNYYRLGNFIKGRKYGA